MDGADDQGNMEAKRMGYVMQSAGYELSKDELLHTFQLGKVILKFWQLLQLAAAHFEAGGEKLLEAWCLVAADMEKAAEPGGAEPAAKRQKLMTGAEPSEPDDDSETSEPDDDSFGSDTGGATDGRIQTASI